MSQKNSMNDGETYVPGLGFVPGNLGHPVTGQIRRLGNVVCLLALTDELCRRFLLFPAAVLASRLGLNVEAGPRLGTAELSGPDAPFVRFAAAFCALLLTFLLARVVFRRAVRGSRVFGRARPGSLAVAVPMLVGVGLLAALLVHYLGMASRAWGIELDAPRPAPVAAWDAAAGFAFLAPLAFGILQELVLRGAMLAALRKFGDGFAVLAAALLAAVWADGFLEACFAFLFGVAAGYFVLRCGSVRAAVIARALLATLLFGFRAARGMLPPATAAAILWGVLLLAAIVALLAYIRFVRLDPRAFRLHPPDAPPPTSHRVGAFGSSPLFWLLAGLLFYRTVTSLQLIGW